MNGSYTIETSNLTKRFVSAPLRSLDRFMWVRGLKKLLRRQKDMLTAVDHVNITVKRGEFFGLLGPNGAGKTTLIKMLCCILRPDEGTALVNGFDILKERNEVKRSINLVASGSWIGLDYFITISQNLTLFAALEGLKGAEARKRVDDALRLVGLEDMADVRFPFLSSGMRQKAMVAKGLLTHTPLLFLDEPTIGIDPLSAHQIRRFVKDVLNKQLGQTIVMTTHYMEEAELLCDRVAIMHEGCIIACDTPSELRKKAKTENVVEIGVVNLTSRVLSELQSMSEVGAVTSKLEDKVIGAGVVRVHLPDKESNLQPVLASIQQAGGEVRYAKEIEPTLEDVFLTMTSRRINE